MKRTLFALVLLSFLLPTTGFGQDKWNPVSYEISFKIKNAGITVNGKFTGLKTDLLFSPDKLETSKLSGSVEAGSLVTGINKRDKTIKEDKYLNADTFKIIEISSEKLYYKGAAYAGTFKVKIKNTTKEIEIPFDFIPFGDEADFKGSFTINRRDFNVGGSSFTMSDDVTVTIAIKAKK